MGNGLRLAAFGHGEYANSPMTVGKQTLFSNRMSTA
jgi:hypothetical protein